MKKSNCLLLLFFLLYSQGMTIGDKQKKDYIINPFVYLLKEKKGIHDISEVVAASSDSFSQNPYIQEVNYGFRLLYG